MFQQLSLSLLGGSCQARPKSRRAPRVHPTPCRPWCQMRLKLPLRRLIKVRKGFIWTRPDGVQFVCKSLRSLVARIRDYDGHLLPKLIHLAEHQRRAGGTRA